MFRNLQLLAALLSSCALLVLSCGVPRVVDVTKVGICLDMFIQIPSDVSMHVHFIIMCDFYKPCIQPLLD